jgi:hypothetical protein
LRSLAAATQPPSVHTRCSSRPTTHIRPQAA